MNVLELLARPEAARTLIFKYSSCVNIKVPGRTLRFNSARLDFTIKTIKLFKYSNVKHHPRIFASLVALRDLQIGLLAFGRENAHKNEPKGFHTVPRQIWLLSFGSVVNTDENGTQGFHKVPRKIWLNQAVTLKCGKYQ